MRKCVTSSVEASSPGRLSDWAGDCLSPRSSCCPTRGRGVIHLAYLDHPSTYQLWSRLCGSLSSPFARHCVFHKYQAARHFAIVCCHPYFLYRSLSVHLFVSLFEESYRPLVSRIGVPAPIATRTPTLKRPLLSGLIFRCALDRRFSKLADGCGVVLLRGKLRFGRGVFFLRVGCHSNHLLSCRVFVMSAFIHSQCRVECAKLFLNIVHGAAEETGVSRESKIGAKFAEPSRTLILSPSTTVKKAYNSTYKGECNSQSLSDL